VRIKFDELPSTALPRSSTARFTEHWQRSVGDEGFLEQVVEKWRSSDIGAGGDTSQQVAMLADGLSVEPAPAMFEQPRMPEPRRHESQLAARMREDAARPAPQAAGASAPPRAPVQAPARPQAAFRKDTPAAPPGGAPPRAGERAPETGAASGEQAVPGAALKSLRDRLIQRQQR
jgi:hypothetical protein